MEILDIRKIACIGSNPEKKQRKDYDTTIPKSDGKQSYLTVAETILMINFLNERKLHLSMN